jgi:molybdate-binding protein/DNA-binding transcriptional regulator YhcF (GntR family)
MEETHLYHEIARTIRKEILEGRYKPGDRLPSVRKLCEDWDCTPGTIQRAYNELARDGLLVSKAGRGTQVAGVLPMAQAQGLETVRRASLVNRLESVLLEALNSGYSLAEIQQAMDLGMDRWRTTNIEQETRPQESLRFTGSHDMLVNELAHTYFGRIERNATLQLSYTGSLGGLIALAEGKTDMAGCHLWDEESGTYNLPYIHRLLPGKDLTVVTLAERRQGLLVPRGNPLNIHSLEDLTRPEIRFVNRQSGSGTRVWLDAMLARQGVVTHAITGYDDERLTHTDIARAVAEGAADVGLGLENAGSAYGLDFVFLNRERYDLVVLAKTAQNSVLKDFFRWLASGDGKNFVDKHRGYESRRSGEIQSG